MLLQEAPHELPDRTEQSIKFNSQYLMECIKNAKDQAPNDIPELLVYNETLIEQRPTEFSKRFILF